MLNIFLDFIKVEGLDKPFILASSGGVDSMVLADCLLKNKIKFELAHCNFQLRIPDANQDEIFLKNFCEKNNVKFHSKRFQTKKYAQEKGISIQMAARELRYQWFDELLEKDGFLLTAHHLNDALETQLFNLIKGTGPKGLLGINFKNNSIIRPLINTSKEDIIKYAKENLIDWREDSSNSKNDYSRNKIRNLIFPIIEEINPNYSQTGKRNLKRMQAANQILNDYFQELKNVFINENGELNFENIKNKAGNNLFLEWYFNDYGFNFDQVESMLNQDFNRGEAKYFLSQNYQLILKNGIGKIQEKNKKDEFKEFEINKSNKAYQTIYGKLQVEVINEFPSLPMLRNKKFIYLDSSKLHEPLTIRKVKKGDKFVPFGMEGKKLLSDFMIEKKFTPEKKQNQLLLCSDNQIAAIIGERVDNRFCLNSSSKEIIKISLIEH